jgi:L-ascorbate metabolism protein UlaG (beta-lactamase superfamily)
LPDGSGGDRAAGTDMTVRLTWWGHATVLVEDGVVILTDPVLTNGVAHLRRRAGAVPPRFGAVDAAVVSHLHADHLHRPSLRMLPRRTPVLLPRGGAGLLRGLGLEPVEVVAGDVVPVGDAVVRVVPAVHGSGRWPAGRLRASPVGYVIENAGATYFAGDTASIPDLDGLHRRLDVALLPVGGWGPWLRGGHLTPEAAARALAGLRARVCVPIHYGTLWPRGMSWVRPAAFHEPGRHLARAATSLAPGVEVRVVHPGGCTTVG